MRHHLFEESLSYHTAVLLKTSSFNKQEILNTYVEPLVLLGLPKTDIIAFTLKYDNGNKVSVSFIKEYLATLLPALDSLGVKNLYVADSAYFKVLTGKPKADVHLGYVLPCHIKGFGHMNVVLGMNYQALIYNPALQAKLDLGLHTLASLVAGNYQAVGTGIIHSAQYPEGVQAIAAALESLHQYPRLSADIEAFSLRFNDAGIGSIAFAWDMHNGLAFACDYKSVSPGIHGTEPYHGEQVNNIAVKRLLKKFFTEYKGEIIWHNGVYDIKIIVLELWMKEI